jgi:hypothetical protein
VHTLGAGPPTPALTRVFGRMWPCPQQFREALDLALAVYPDAARRGVRVIDDGLLLAPADPPVAPRPARWGPIAGDGGRPRPPP